MRSRSFAAALLVLLIAGAAPAWAQEKPEEDTAAQDNRTQAVADAIIAKRQAEEQAASFAVPALTADNSWNLDLSDGGRVTVQLRPDQAPQSVARIKTLTRQGFYDGTIFHRVIDGFMAQGGDPTGTGQGGSKLPDLKAEFNEMPHVRGEVSMARADDENSANSQFFIMLAPNLKLDGHYSPVGRVISGMAYVDAIQRGEPPEHPTRIVHATIGNEAAAPAPTAAAAGAASAAAAQAASDQSSDAKVASDEASSAAAQGDTANAADRSKDAAVQAAGAAAASQDAAEAAAQAKPKGKRR